MDNETRENISNFLREYKRAMQEFQDSPQAEAIVQTLKAVNDFNTQLNTQLAISIEKSGLLEVMRDFSASLEKIRPALEYLSQYDPALYEQVDDVLAQVEPNEEPLTAWEQINALSMEELQELAFALGIIKPFCKESAELIDLIISLIGFLYFFKKFARKDNHAQ